MYLAKTGETDSFTPNHYEFAQERTTVLYGFLIATRLPAALNC